MCAGEPKIYLNEKRSNILQGAVGLVQVYSEKTASTMEYEAFVMSRVDVMLLNFRADF